MINFGQNAAPEIDPLLYGGNAALAGGFDSAGLPAGTGADSLATVDDMVKTVNQQQFVRNTAKYKQAIDDRDKTMSLMTDPTLMMSNDIMDKDRAPLEEQRQKLEDTWKANPNLMNDNQAFLKFQQDAAKFRELASSSKSRNLEYKRQMQQIAAEPNMAIRNERLKHLDEQIGNGPMHQIDPYFNNPTFDAEKYFKDIPSLQVGGTQFTMGEDGIAKGMKVMQTPISAFKAPFSPQNLMANNGQALQDVQILHDNFVNSEFGKDENYLRSVNQKLDQINKDNNLSPSDPNYFKPIAQKTDAGWSVTDSPADLAAGVYAYKNYKRESVEDLSKDYQNQKLNFVKAQSELDKNKQAVLTSKALADQYKANAILARQKSQTEEADRESEKAELTVPVTDAINAFNDALKVKAYRPITSLPAPIQQTMIANGITANSKIAALPMDQKYVKMLSEPETNEKGSNSGTLRKATRIYATKTGDNINSMRIFGFDSKGNFIKSVDVANGVEEIVKYNQGYQTTDIQNKLQSARTVLSDMLHHTGHNAPATKTVLPDPIKKLSGGADVVPVVIPEGTFYPVNGKYYDANGNEIK